MYKTYFRQAVGMLKQNPFISVISILGTALAIMMIMTMIVTDGIQNASVAPENKRDRTLYLVSFAERDTSNGKSSMYASGGLPYEIMKNYVVPALKTPELTVATSDMNAVVKREGTNDASYQMIQTTDADYWKLYTHTFTEGKPYGQENFESGLRVAVISETTAKTLFKGEDPIGKNIEINFIPYRVGRHRAGRIPAVPDGRRKDMDSLHFETRVRASILQRHAPGGKRLRFSENTARSE